MSEDIEIKQISDREIWVGDNRYYLGEDKILYVTAVGEADEKMALAEKKIAFKLLSMVEGKVNVLVDLNKAGKQSSEARKIRKELNEHEKVGKSAHFGTHPVAKALASFVMVITNKKDLRFFNSREDALMWLNEENR